MRKSRIATEYKIIVFFICFLSFIMAVPRTALSVVIPLVGTIDNVEELKMAIMTINNSVDDENTINLGSVDFVLDTALDPIEKNLIINGGSEDPSDTSISGDNLFRIFEINTSVEVTINNLTMTNGKAPNGGAIFNHNGGILTINNCIIKESEADTDFGGGIYNLNATLEINESNIEDNVANELGGGIFNNNMLTITDSTLSGNSADQGGCTFNDDGELNIINSNILENSAVDFAGGVRTEGENANVTVSTSTFSNNTGGAGGAFAINMSTVVVNDSTFNQNVSMAGGGAFRNFGNLTINRSTLSNNSSTDEGGGAIYYGAGSITIYNSTFSGNDAKTHGGAIFDEMDNDMLTINNSTFTANNADEIGGAINIIDGMPATIKNTIIAGNTAVDDDPDVAGTFTSEGHNLIGIIGNASGFIDGVNGDQVGTSGSPIDPLLVFPLQDNGGPTFTLPLLMNSPAIDAGSPDMPGSGGTACESTDQRGVPRPQGSVCDIGAFELSSNVVCGGNECSPGDANADGFVDTFDIPIVIEKFLNPNFSVPGNGDCNMDGFVDTFDIPCIINIFLNP